MEQEINALKVYIRMAEELIKLGNNMVTEATIERDKLQEQLIKLERRMKPPQGVIQA
ncbi:hypothetical protein UFOVP448_45 [uncultured Caudovirales phage]|uniref:Uncharacterized protein n=1 Tax=uncultured Caudovirales phage TaxID=2100421 RepID=A0A6J5M852_9CAUD|nr:hypothetical protein UFOVP448_45 [uncultured Caudovirales phage]